MPNLPDLTNMKTYKESCLTIAGDMLKGRGSIAEVAETESEINVYPNLGRLHEPREIRLLDVDAIGEDEYAVARNAVLDGKVFWEHAAAGEATRLGLGTKYLILPQRDLADSEMPTDNLLPLDLGHRHMLQLAFDLYRLAREHGREPAEVLSRQCLLVILNENTADEITSGVMQAGFFGFSRENFHFMVQPAFRGITFKDGAFSYASESPKRLHNHGQMAMQQTMDRQIFKLDQVGRRIYLRSDHIENMLETMVDKISYNIEDLDYLTGSIAWNSLAKALKLGEEGYRMIMEIVANDPENPIKGGLAAYDPVLERNVMIESFQLKGLPVSEIKFFNKNFNHYTQPVEAWRKLKEKKLPMPVTVKGDYLYFQPVQGDINFLVKTAFVMRKELKPIRAWKSRANTPAAIQAMRAQDEQEGFKAFAEEVMGKKLQG